jgi:hypothetical protein
LSRALRGRLRIDGAIVEWTADTQLSENQPVKKGLKGWCEMAALKYTRLWRNEPTPCRYHANVIMLVTLVMT